MTLRDIYRAISVMDKIKSKIHMISYRYSTPRRKLTLRVLASTFPNPLLVTFPLIFIVLAINKNSRLLAMRHVNYCGMPMFVSSLIKHQ